MHRTLPLLALLLVLPLVAVPWAAAQDGATSDPAAAPAGRDLALVHGEAPVDGVAASVLLSQASTPTGEVAVVLLASTEAFADAMASSSLQGHGPLLLIPPTLPIPPAVHAELVRLDPADVLLLGGTAAIGADVEAELARLGFRTVRIAGPTRIETATAMAEAAAPEAVTALLVRAFDAGGGDGSGAWADSVAAGAAAAQMDLPVLLTQSGALSASTAAYLDRSQVRTVIIVGGESAVPRAIEDELLARGLIVTRVAGPDRHETALRVNALRRLTPGGGAIVVDGVAEGGWQVGFAAARLAARSGAPILTTAGATVPASVLGSLPTLRPTGLTCAVPAVTCAAVREAAGSPARPLVSYNPAPGSTVSSGEVIVLAVDDPDRVLAGEMSAASDCSIDGGAYLTEGSAPFSLSISGEEAGGDQPPLDGTIDVQPFPSTGDALGIGGPPQPVQTAAPIEGPQEPAPGAPTSATCTVTTTFVRRDGTEMTDVASFLVGDLHPRFRVTSAPLVEDRPLAFLDRSDGVVADWAWDFGDGTAGSDERNPVHTYARPGCYDVTLGLRSPLRHWLSGAAFTDSEVRTLPIDPSGTRRGILEVLILDARSQTLPGQTAELVTTTGTVLDTTQIRADGRAAFDDLLPGAYGVRLAAQPQKVLTQQVLAGHTICPTLLLIPTGTLDVLVVDALGTPVADAVIEVREGDRKAAAGFTGSDGHFTIDSIAVGTYDVSVLAQGLLPQTLSTSVQEDTVTNLPFTLQAPAPPSPTPTPTPTS